ncbi:TIGR03915 family putative DNA repair protein [uncultured Dokdonia sp.]|uniref:TIGR03915 family putative DNA repair protein n=1 Tax=uncultured Dokdonia sp. TaxID=575653 RepID=UPI00262AD7D6|nr:TIGR03915 family putative DNA repair protein [uncultured Dokdonia sp.]
MAIYRYDSSFEGFLTCVFEYYEQKPTSLSIVPNYNNALSIFDTKETITTDSVKAERVWKGLKQTGGAITTTAIYRAFLSEKEGIENTLLSYIVKLFKHQTSIEDYTDFDVVQIRKVVKMVGREKHRMDAFVRFRETKDNIYFATIAPDFNVLPLNSNHFKKRYADQKWLIYDLKRKYGIYYDLHTVETIELALTSDVNTPSKATIYFTEEELQYEELWQNYFKSTNIASRKNMKLHMQHVPKRYWKYLSEKRPS